MLDIIETKLYKPPPIKPSKKIPKYRISIPFVNKALDFINLSQLIRSYYSKDNMPPSLSDEDIPMVVYSLSDPIRSKILNYKKFVKELNLDRFKEDNDVIKCNCKNYAADFLDSDRNHILTGNLQIVKNNKLRKLLSKGPKYREPTELKWDVAKSIIEGGVNDFMKGLSETKRISPLTLVNWKNSIFELVDNRIRKCGPKIKSKTVKSVFDDCEAKAELKRLQNDFVIVPIDKAANNLVFICKQHYATQHNTTQHKIKLNHFMIKTGSGLVFQIFG